MERLFIQRQEGGPLEPFDGNLPIWLEERVNKYLALRLKGLSHGEIMDLIKSLNELTD